MHYFASQPSQTSNLNKKNSTSDQNFPEKGLLGAFHPHPQLASAPHEFIFSLIPLTGYSTGAQGGHGTGRENNIYYTYYGNLEIQARKQESLDVGSCSHERDVTCWYQNEDNGNVYQSKTLDFPFTKS